MTHPLVTRLTTELGWRNLTDMTGIAEFIEAPGVHVLFVPGDASRNLETPDVAVILPELHMAFQGRFDCAVVDDAVEAEVRERSGVFKTPSLIFYREGELIGAIPKVRDWSEYVQRISQITAQPIAAE
ncbi:hydrogenase accessory protein [Frigidibacter sp. ROC022]|uniref:hydrogenase accessory protein n=1 Tax=Frigidibacter sp. ROC022 TaxID=2971796 RepID=UPI00215AFDC0|nr:hydrogenase accessory protein [Frigidibacter sp. ROC022]MCR8723105.1 hydrogenase accessory protein [Frigidibacter sp. ROC022]